MLHRDEEEEDTENEQKKTKKIYQQTSFVRCSDCLEYTLFRR